MADGVNFILTRRAAIYLSESLYIKYILIPSGK